MGFSLSCWFGKGDGAGKWLCLAVPSRDPAGTSLSLGKSLAESPARSTSPPPAPGSLGHSSFQLGGQPGPLCPLPPAGELSKHELSTLDFHQWAARAEIAGDKRRCRGLGGHQLCPLCSPFPGKTEGMALPRKQAGPRSQLCCLCGKGFLILEGKKKRTSLQGNVLFQDG